MRRDEQRAVSMLRAADPERDNHYSHSRDVALMERIIDSPVEGVTAEPRQPGTRVRRMVVAGALVAAAVTAVVVTGVVTRPGSPGPAAQAWAATANPDGSVSISIKWPEFRDPAALNARLAALGVRAAVLPYMSKDTCTAPQPRTLPPYIDPHWNGVGDAVPRDRQWFTPNGTKLASGFKVWPDRIPTVGYGVVVVGTDPDNPHADVGDPMMTSYLAVAIPQCVAWPIDR